MKERRSTSEPLCPHHPQHRLRLPRPAGPGRRAPGRAADLRLRQPLRSRRTVRQSQPGTPRGAHLGTGHPGRGCPAARHGLRCATAGAECGPGRRAGSGLRPARHACRHPGHPQPRSRSGADPDAVGTRLPVLREPEPDLSRPAGRRPQRAGHRRLLPQGRRRQDHHRHQHRRRAWARSPRWAW